MAFGDTSDILHRRLPGLVLRNLRPCPDVLQSPDGHLSNDWIRSAQLM